MGTTPPATLFVHLDRDLAEALATIVAISTETGKPITRRDIISAMIAERAGKPHPAINRVRLLWTRYRKAHTR